MNEIKQILKIARELISGKPSFHDLIDDYKYNGFDSRRAWDQYIIDMQLKPEMDAKEFFSQYSKAIAKKLDRTKINQFEKDITKNETPTEKKKVENWEFEPHGKKVKVKIETGKNKFEWVDGIVQRQLLTGTGKTLYEVKWFDSEDNEWMPATRMNAENVKF